jgi:hypothetical protein
MPHASTSVSFVKNNLSVFGFASPADALHQASKELLDNALDACLQVKEKDHRITIIIKNEQHGGDVEISVTDSGAGIQNPGNFLDCFSSEKYEGRNSSTSEKLATVGRFGVGLSACLLYCCEYSSSPLRIITRALREGANLDDFYLLADFTSDKSSGKVRVSQKREQPAELVSHLSLASHGTLVNLRMPCPPDEELVTIVLAIESWLRILVCTPSPMQAEVSLKCHLCITSSKVPTMTPDMTGFLKHQYSGLILTKDNWEKLTEDSRREQVGHISSVPMGAVYVGHGSAGSSAVPLSVDIHVSLDYHDTSVIETIGGDIALTIHRSVNAVPVLAMQLNTGSGSNHGLGPPQCTLIRGISKHSVWAAYGLQLTAGGSMLAYTPTTGPRSSPSAACNAFTLTVLVNLTSSPETSPGEKSACLWADLRKTAVSDVLFSSSNIGISALTSQALHSALSSLKGKLDATGKPELHCLLRSAQQRRQQLLADIYIPSVAQSLSVLWSYCSEGTRSRLSAALLSTPSSHVGDPEGKTDCCHANDSEAHTLITDANGELVFASEPAMSLSPYENEIEGHNLRSHDVRAEREQIRLMILCRLEAEMRSKYPEQSLNNRPLPRTSACLKLHPGPSMATASKDNIRKSARTLSPAGTKGCSSSMIESSCDSDNDDELRVEDGHLCGYK